MIDGLRRLGEEALTFIEDDEYFMMHAARQSGKTTLLLSLSSKIISSGERYALYCSLENLDKVVDVAVGIPAIIGSLKQALKGFGLPGAESFASGLDLKDCHNALQASLTISVDLLTSLWFFSLTNQTV
jgi:hypothetical protein